MAAWLAAMKGSVWRFAFATVTTPMICPSLRTGAATYMTEVLSSAGSSRVERAP